MNGVNKTLYIPLYGKAYVSKKGIISEDKKAEEIWDKEGFELKGKSRSKWLAYYMGIRARVYDDWLREKMDEFKDSAVIHIGCGLDSRVLRVGTNGHKWYDVDFADVINERKLYYTEDNNYRMLEGDARKPEWLSEIPENKCAVVVMEGISMYLKADELKALIAAINSHFDSVALMIDFYTTMGAKISKYKNPINDVGVTEVYGTDNPETFEMESFSFIKEHNMVPDKLVNELKGMEKCLFRSVYGGKLSKKIYRLFEYSSI